MDNQSKILVIDDEPIARITIEALLSPENYKLYFAENGVEGVALAIEIMPDIILLDVMMPGINGFEVCRQIRLIPNLAEVPIILITSLDDRESRMTGLKAGADDFITKPFDIFELLVRIQNMTRLNRYRLLMEKRQEAERLNNDLIIAYDKTIEGWSRAIDLRDKKTEGHTQRATEMTIKFACAVGLDKETQVHIKRGALLHDVGKLGIPDSILLKADTLNAEEWEIMHQHPIYAYNWLYPIEYLRPAIDIPFCHHEKWDGSGYPRGLVGEEIPLAARLFAVTDVWDALRSDRPYRAGWSVEKVVDHIRAQAGTHFDPQAVEVFLQAMGFAA